jgi:uncharacterized membrane protein YoaK (UPF0700 family)
MAEPHPRVVAALLLLTFGTGIVDAASVLGLHVFTANMTGNVVFLGFALAGNGIASVSTNLNALGSFMLGAVIGGRASKVISTRSVRLGFGVELALLSAATIVALVHADATTSLLVSLLGVAMGLRNGIVRKLAVPDLTTTVLTLTVTGVAADSSLAGGSNLRWQRRCAAIAAMLAGALLGAALVPRGLGIVIAAATLIEAIALVLLATADRAFA